MAQVIDADVWDRQRRVKGWDQDSIAKARCAVFGAGALGNETVKLLLQLGVMDLTVIDFDQVEKANLNRCVFFTNLDAENHELKAKALCREARRINPSARLRFEPIAIEELPDSFYSGLDFAFGCLDNLGARLHANSHCYGKCAYIDGGTTGFSGKVQTVASPSACVECGFTNRDYKLLWKKYSCVGEVLDFIEPAMPALPTTTSIVSAVQANEFVKLAHKASRDGGRFSLPENDLVGRLWFYNGLTMQSKIMSLSRRATCPVHR